MLPFSNFHLNILCQRPVTGPCLFSCYTSPARKVQLFPGLAIPKFLFLPHTFLQSVRLPLPMWTSACMCYRFLKLNMSQTDWWPSLPHFKSTLPPGFHPLQNDFLAVRATNLHGISIFTFSSSTPTFNESISVLHLIYKTLLSLLCPFIAVSSASSLAHTTALAS